LLRIFIRRARAQTIKMKKLTLITAFLTLTCSIHSQIISQWSWDSNPVTNADIGPNATSVSGSATSDVGGVGGTNGLNAGTPKADISMFVPGSPTFDVEGIDVSFDYHREESQCNWVRRGNSLIIDGSNQFSVSYRVDDGGGGFNTVNSGNAFNIPNDDTYRNYRFIYLSVTGEGFLLVDGAVVWYNDGPDNRALYWTGAGDLEIGDGCDGTGNNDTFMDNLIIGAVTFSGLPIELLNFSAKPKMSTVELKWSTASETDNDFFTLERSKNGKDWVEIGTVEGAGTSNAQLDYSFEDESPLNGKSYYRLKQTDFNGDFEYSKVEHVTFEGLADNVQLFPNPTSGELNMVFEKVGSGWSIMNLLGQDLSQEIVILLENPYEVKLDVSNLADGFYFIKTDTQLIKFQKR
jgi:hypothetical protein